MSGVLRPYNVLPDEWQPSSDDLALERELMRLKRRIDRTKSKIVLRNLWSEFSFLVEQRRPQMVAFIEKQKGIHREQD